MQAKKIFLCERMNNMSGVDERKVPHQIIARALFDAAMPTMDQHLQDKGHTREPLSKEFFDQLWLENSPNIVPKVKTIYVDAFIARVLDPLDDKQLNAMYDLATGEKFNDGPEMLAISASVQQHFKSETANIVGETRDKSVVLFREWMPKLLAAVLERVVSTSKGPRLAVEQQQQQQYDPDEDFEDKVFQESKMEEVD